MTQEFELDRRPFAEAAFDLRRRGLAVLPCPGSNGKSPKGAVSGFGNWRIPPSEAFLNDLVRIWGRANIGVVTGPVSGVTVVDVDGGQDLVNDMLNLFGDTPFMTSTPSGGRHLWYRYEGEPNANLRHRHNLPVDIKAKSGVVIVPPSRNLTTGVYYGFERGTFDEISRLPTIQSRARELLSPRRVPAAQSREPTCDLDLTPGQRNRGLFRRGLRLTRRCTDLNQLIDLLLKENVGAALPLEENEVAGIAESVWKYESRGDNWVGRSPRAQVTQALLQFLADDPNGPEALWLFCRLSMAHGSKSVGVRFAVSPEAMANGPLLPLSARSIRRALGVLVSLNVLERVHAGGRGPRDPALYTWHSAGSW